MIALIQKTWSNYFLKPYLKNYLQKSRIYRYEDLELVIHPGVFHPHYFFSTSAFITFLKELELKDKKFCELGAGSGLISFLAFKKNAKVSAVELNPSAVKGLKENLDKNFGDSRGFEIYHSDLFENVPPSAFDLIFINPPWFFKKAETEAALAWNCGENGEYFTKLFAQIPAFCKKETEIYMILSENSEINKIQKLALQQRISMQVEKEVKIKWEKNYIFKLSINHGAGTG